MGEPGRRHRWKRTSFPRCERLSFDHLTLLSNPTSPTGDEMTSFSSSHATGTSEVRSAAHCGACHCMGFWLRCSQVVLYPFVIMKTDSKPATKADIQELKGDIGKLMEAVSHLYDADETWKDEILESNERWKDEILTANERWNPTNAGRMKSSPRTNVGRTISLATSTWRSRPTAATSSTL